MGGGVVTEVLAGAVAVAGALPTLAYSRVAPEELLGAIDAVLEGTGGPVTVNFLIPFLDIAPSSRRPLSGRRPSSSSG